MKKSLALTRAQSAALARLLRMHLDSYDEALGPEQPRVESEPLNGNDLDLLEPLVALLEKE